MIRLLSGIALLIALAPLPGCLIVAAGAGAAAAVAVTGEDSVEIVIDRSMDVVYEEAVMQVESRGFTTERNPEFYRFEGGFEGNYLWVNISPLRSDRTLLRVRARKMKEALPNVSLAREIANATSLSSLSRKKSSSGE